MTCTLDGWLTFGWKTWWRKRQTVHRRCWYCESLFLFPKWPGLHNEHVYNEWYCPECRRR